MTDDTEGLTPRVDGIIQAIRLQYQRVAAADLGDELMAGALVVDVRPLEQRTRDGVLPDSIVIDRNVLEWRLDPSSPFSTPEAVPGRRIVLVCNEGFGSTIAVGSLLSLGVSATDLIGGFQALKAFETT